MSGSTLWQKTADFLKRPVGGGGDRLRWRGFFTLLGSVFLAVWLLFAATVMFLRYAVLPNIEHFQSQIAHAASSALGLPVRIGAVSAGWERLRPELVLNDVQVLDKKGNEALSFRRVEAVLSWRSLALLDLRLHRLSAEGPTVQAERQSDGRVYVAGFQVYPPTDDDAGLADWALHQDAIDVTGARLVWRDALRMPAMATGDVPSVALEAVSFRLENRHRRHRFALTALPPEDLAGPVDMRGDFRGQSLSRLDEWQGQVYLSAPKIDLAAWRAWLDFPIEVSEGRGGMRVWGRVDGVGLAEISADLALSDVKLRLSERRQEESGPPVPVPLEQSANGLAEFPQRTEFTAPPELPELDLANFEGRLGVRREGLAPNRAYYVSVQDLGLQLRDGKAIPQLSAHVKWTPLSGRNGGGSEGLAVLTQIDLGHLAELAKYFPLDQNTRETLQSYAPEGELRNLNLLWRGNTNRLESYRLSVDFSALGMRPKGLLPGFSNLSGSLLADEGKGQLEIASSPMSLQFPEVFSQPDISLDELNAKVGWSIQSGVLDFVLQEAVFSGPDAAGSGRGRYRLALNQQAPIEFKSPGNLDLTGHLTEANAGAVWRYLPKLISPDVRHWVRDAVRGGRIRDVDYVLRGPLDEFPFPHNERGQFMVKAKISEGDLLFAPAWPEVRGLETELRFEGSGVGFAAQQATMAGVKLGKVHASIADFSIASPKLVIIGEAEAPVPGFIQFLDQSPLGKMLGRFYEALRLTGDGKLKLDVEIPLDNPDAVRVKGDFDLAGGGAIVDPLLPPVSALSGRVSFTESTAHANALVGQFFDKSLRIDLQAKGSEVRVAAFGEATVPALQRQYRSPLLKAFSGTMPFQAAVSVRDGRVGFAVQSSLEGLQSTLPEPFNKSAESVLPIRFSRAALGDRAVTNKANNQAKIARTGKPSPEISRDQLRIEVGNLAGATLIRRLDDNRALIERGLVAVGSAWSTVPMPDKGLRVVVNQPSIDLDLWHAALVVGTPEPTTESAGLAEGIDWPTPHFDIRANTVRLISRQWRDVNVQATPMRGGVSGTIDARDMSGEWSWDNTGKGALRARLKQLVLPDTQGALPKENGKASASTGANGLRAGSEVVNGAAGVADAPENLPALDVVADQLILGDKRLGRLEVVAENDAGRWRVPRFHLSSPEGNMSGSGFWTPATSNAAPLTQVDLSIDASDIGKLMTRFGYPEGVRRGQGKLAGRLSWQGSPTMIHVPTLTGLFELTAESGQFNKLEPGIGKLISLVSLQMLPRRITLDFRDIFSDGFAFDNIKGTVAVSNGALSTNNFVIEGSAAKVLMSGSADLANDQTKVLVSVQPEFGSTLALGAAVVVNPVVGVATLLAQKLLSDPLNKVFAFEYEVTGSLADPQIRKVSGSPPSASAAPATPNSPALAPPTVDSQRLTPGAVNSGKSK